MTTRKPLVVISGKVQQLPSADSIDIGSSAMPSNIVATGTTTTIPVDQSLILAVKLSIVGTGILAVNGYLEIIG